jgi:hypothetical protein
MNQPNFHIAAGGNIPVTDYDNLSQADLDKLINDAHRLKTGRAGRLVAAPPPAPKGYVDLDAILGKPE